MVAQTGAVDIAFNGGPIDQTSNGAGQRLIAVDRVGSFGAAFFLTLSESGDWAVDAALYALKGDRWQAMSSGGVTVGDWNGEAGRVPSPGGWTWGVLWTLGTSGQNAHDESGTEVRVAAIPGFAAEVVAKLLVETPGLEPRPLRVEQPLGSFIALGVASGLESMTLTALGSDGAVLGRRHFDVQ